MAKLYQVKALVAKVAIGPATGNRIARILKQGDIIPEGVDQAKLEALEKLGMITALQDPAEEAQALADADAKAAAAEETKRKANESRAKTAAEKKAAEKKAADEAANTDPEAEAKAAQAAEVEAQRQAAVNAK